MQYNNSRWVLRHLPLVGGHVGDVCLVEPLDPEVAVEVGGGLAEPQLGVVLQGVLHVHREQAPDRGRGELESGEKYIYLNFLCGNSHFFKYI